MGVPKKTYVIKHTVRWDDEYPRMATLTAVDEDEVKARILAEFGDKNPEIECLDKS